MIGNGHVRFGPEAAGKDPHSRHLASGLPVPSEDRLLGRIERIDVLGGLIHEYRRAA